jgi:hypothetical protein
VDRAATTTWPTWPNPITWSYGTTNTRMTKYATYTALSVAFDAYSSSSYAAGDLSWTHTPVGTPKGVLVLIYGNKYEDDIASVSYGGVAMEEVGLSPQLHNGASSDVFAVHAFFLGSNIPTGAQTVAVTHGTGTSSHRAGCITLTADGDTAVEDDGAVNSNSVANPSVTLTIDEQSFCALVFGSGQGAISGATPLADWSSRTESDMGVCIGGIYTKNDIVSTDTAAGFTLTQLEQ